MNAPAAIISAGVGVAFFAAASVFYYQPSFINIDPIDLLTTHNSKARAAVSRLLLKPASAEFSGLRSVEVDKAKYVCGSVNAKDRTDSYAGARAFVYTVAIDFARIDDDGQIATKHDAYRACPVSEEEALAKQQKLEISPRQMEIAKTIQKAIPTADTSALTNLSSQFSQSGSAGTGGSPEQLAKSSGPSSATGVQAQGPFKTTLDSESEWRSDRPPAAWPVFPPGHALAKPGGKRGNAEAIAAAKDIENRWAQSKAGNVGARPSSAEISDALRSLMLIDPKADEFAQAWATFVRLRKIDREAQS
jgi:hypothetical protein